MKVGLLASGSLGMNTLIKIINDFNVVFVLTDNNSQGVISVCKEKKIPVICFPKGINKDYKEFNNVVNPDGINLDYNVDPSWAKKNLSNVVLQGGLDPKVLLSNNQEFLREAKKYLDIFKGLPYIFNLGHGLLPETEPDKVAELVKFYREY